MEKLERDEFLPWNIPVEYRLKELFYYHELRKFKTVVYLYEKSDTSTFRYRVYNMCQALSESVTWKGIYFFEDELFRLKEYISKIDLIVLVRFHWSSKLADFVFCAKEKKKKILFDVDDLVFEMKYFPELLQSINVNVKSEVEVAFWENYVNGLNHTALLCDACITTNEYLKKFLCCTFQKECFVVPNTFNTWQEKISDECYSNKKILKSSDEFVIGYFSGSHTHEKDFAIIAEAVRDLLYAFPDIKLVIGGYMKVPGFMNQLVRMKRVEFLPFLNFVELQRAIAQVNVNVVPLVDTVFTNCKSELKYFEASIVGTVSIMSPVYTYKSIITHNKNGILSNDANWYEQILNVYYKSDNIERIIENAHDFCKCTYRYSVIREYIESYCDKMTSIQR